MKSKSFLLLCMSFVLLLTGCASNLETSSGTSSDVTETMSDTDRITTEMNETIEAPITSPTIYELNARERNENNPYYRQLQEKVNNREEPLTWLFCGDSITANDRNYSGGFRNYSEIFESYLIQDLDRKNDYVVNSAVSGWKVADIQYQREIAAYSPDIVYVKIGTNDYFFDDAQTNTYKRTLTALFQNIVDSGVIPIVAISCPFHPDWSTKSQITAFETNYTKAVIEVADELGLLLVNYFTPFADRAPESFALWQNGDLLHPSRLGFLKFMQVFVHDLGLEVPDSAILTTSCDEPLTGEVLETYAAAKVTHYCNGVGSQEAKTFAQTYRKNGCLLLGGSIAKGDNASCLTRRTFPQLLGSNNLRGIQQSAFGTFAELTEIVEASDHKATLILMPEAYDKDGNSLTEGSLTALLDAAVATGKPLLILTPPVNPVNELINEGNRAIAETLRQEAENRNLLLIDLFAYTEDLEENTWYDEDGFPNYNGCNALYQLINRSLN